MKAVVTRTVLKDSVTTENKQRFLFIDCKLGESINCDRNSRSEQFHISIMKTTISLTLSKDKKSVTLVCNGIVKPLHWSAHVSVQDLFKAAVTGIEKTPAGTFGKIRYWSIASFQCYLYRILAWSIIGSADLQSDD